MALRMTDVRWQDCRSTAYVKLDAVDTAVHIFFQLIKVLGIATHIGGNNQVFI